MTTAAPQNTAWNFRPAQTADNAALCALAERCPMEGDITICVHRDPDFLALDALLGDRWHVLVAEVDGAVVGCVAWAIREAYVNGMPMPTAYAGDLKVDPKYRNRGVGAALARAVHAELGRLDAALPTLFTTLAGNRPASRLPCVRTDDAVSRQLGAVRVHSIPLLARRKLRAPSGYRVLWAAWDDLENMATCWATMQSTRQFARVMQADAFADTIRRAPGLNISSYLIALDRTGRIAGFLALWDQHHLKTTHVLRYSPRQAVFRRGFNIAAPLLGAARLPRPGGVLRGVHAFHVCVESGAILRALLAEAHGQLAGQGYAYLALGLDRRDPAQAALTGMWAQPTDVDVFVGVPGGRHLLPDLDSQPVHYDTALV